MYDTTLAERLRAAGLTVHEVEGWKERANSSNGSFSPQGFVVHHTAGAPPSAGVAPGLEIVIYGRPDLSGPLANVYLDFNGDAYTVAAGSANHAGQPDNGSYKGMTGNSSAWGMEIEHPGTYPLEAGRIEAAARVVAATIRGTCTETMVCYHAEWAPSRKIDLATAPDPNTFRTKVAGYLKGGGEEMGYPPWTWDWLSWYLTTNRDPDERPDSAPDKIPDWAWEAQKEVEAINKRYGMTPGERDWIDWFLGGKEGERPDVPQTIPDRWWKDNEWADKR